MTSSKVVFGRFLFLVLGSVLGSFSSGATIYSLKDVKKSELNEFRDMVEKLDLPKEYMKKDAYLLRYLTAKHFNLKEALVYLQEILTIRETEKLNSILEEDWSEYEKRFPYSTTSVNKEGRTILYYPFGKWDISQELNPKNFQRFERFAGLKILEEMDKKIHLIKKENNPIQQFDIIVDFDGCNCAKNCMWTYREIMKQSEIAFIHAIHKVYFINTPVESISRLESFLSKDKTRESFDVLGGIESYQPVLLKDIELEQFPKEMLRQLEWSWTKFIGWC